MDHKEAIRLQAAEKYVLSELSGTLRDEFEEHFFECAECALDMKAAASFVDTTRDVLRQGVGNVAQEQEETGWIWERYFGWLKPVVAVPALAVLLLALAYQNFVTVPRLKSAGSVTKPQLLNSFSLVAGNVRGGEATKVQVREGESFALDFDFLPTKLFDHYICQLQDEAGSSGLQLEIPADKASQEVHLLVTSGLVHSGRYSVVVSGDPTGKGDWSKENQVLKVDFVVEISR